MNNLNCCNTIRATKVAASSFVATLLAIILTTGFSSLARAQAVIGVEEKPSKQEGKSQDGLFDYETTQDQDKQLQARSELKAGDQAPEVQLTPFAGSKLGSAVQLSSLYSEKPVVVFMGSCTCGLTKRNVPQMEELYKKYRSKANFAFVYMKDAHPAPEKSVDVDGETVQLAQPKTMSHRIDLAKHMLGKTGLSLPVYIDDMKGTGRKAFTGFHLSAYVIDTDGKLAFVRRYKYDVADVKTALTSLLEK